MRSEKARKAAAREKRSKRKSVLKPDRRKDRNKDPRSLAFLEFVKTKPCVIEECVRPEIEAAHIGGNSAAKASNYRAIPLCTHHHRDSPASQETLKSSFGTYWGLDIEAIIRRLNEEFDSLYPRERA